MTLPVRLTPAAKKDLALAERWYRPELYGIVESRVRRAPVRRFSFSIFYRILPQGIEVIAVVHQARNARTWQRRT